MKIEIKMGRMAASVAVVFILFQLLSCMNMFRSAQMYRKVTVATSKVMISSVAHLEKCSEE